MSGTIERMMKGFGRNKFTKMFGPFLVIIGICMIFAILLSKIVVREKLPMPACPGKEAKAQ